MFIHNGNSSGYLTIYGGSLGFLVGGGFGSRWLPNPPPTHDLRTAGGSEEAKRNLRSYI